MGCVGQGGKTKVFYSEELFLHKLPSKKETSLTNNSLRLLEGKCEEEKEEKMKKKNSTIHIETSICVFSVNENDGNSIRDRLYTQMASFSKEEEKVFR